MLSLLTVVNGVGGVQGTVPVQAWGGLGSGPAGFAMDATMKFGNLTLNGVDLALLVLCPVFSSLGVLVSFVLKEQEKKPESSFLRNSLEQVGQYCGNLFIGLVLGLLIALFFVGAINSEVTSLAKVLALSILLGYQAKTIWFSQEKVINNAIQKKVKQALDSIKAD